MLSPNQQTQPFQLQTMAMTPNRIFPLNNIEALIRIRLTPGDHTTTLYLNSESTELVWKSRDKSYTKSILEHMMCSHQLSLPRPDLPPIQMAPDDKIIQLELINQQVIVKNQSTRGSKAEFVIARTVMRRGKPIVLAGAKVESSLLSNSPNLMFSLKRIQLPDGQWSEFERAEIVSVSPPKGGPLMPPAHIVLHGDILPLGWQFRRGVTLNQVSLSQE